MPGTRIPPVRLLISLSMLERVTPVNLMLDLRQLYNTWNAAKRFTWNRAKTMTWKTMREEVLPE